MNVIVVLLMLALGVFSSTGPEPVDEADEPASAPAADPFPDDLGPLRTDAQIEERFLTRYPLPACDLVDLGSGMAADPADYTCLQDAVKADEGVELVIVTMLPGGAQVYAYYRNNPDGPLEVFADLRAGPGDRDWNYLRCRPSENIAEEPCA